MPQDESTEQPGRRRRRAVGPAGAAPAPEGELSALVQPAAPDRAEQAGWDEQNGRDAHLRREVPPHHGG